MLGLTEAPQNLIKTAANGPKIFKKYTLTVGNKSFQAKSIGIIDLGTNSVRLDVYELRGRLVERIYRNKIMIRLGDGVFKTGKLSRAGMSRGLSAFEEFQSILESLSVHEIAAYGTSAIRTAKNSKVFLKTIESRTGIRVKTITGKEEGRLIALGITTHIQPPKGYYGLIDIGGGSTEVSICLGRKVRYCTSLKLGANRLQQMYCKHLPLSMKAGERHPMLEMRQHIKSNLRPLESKLKKFPVKVLIGSSGTIRALGKILKKLNRPGQPIRRADLSGLISEMQGMSREDIGRIPGLEPKRVDLILPGAILLEEILFAFHLRHLAITDLALRDGILLRELKRHVL